MWSSPPFPPPPHAHAPSPTPPQAAPAQHALTKAAPKVVVGGARGAKRTGASPAGHHGVGQRVKRVIQAVVKVKVQVKHVKVVPQAGA
jgi:hypothetical protein